ncbi:MAG: fumarylacetoacetate hydrolase family protein [Actinobacteria bacterium]|nr:fumarylacetoacetate hydrolase family protein [Actinomycetota bacterium]
MKLARIRSANLVLEAEVVDGAYRVVGGDRAGMVLLPQDVVLLPPAVPTKILAVGWNFPAHIDEIVARLPKDKFSDVPDEPIIFLKPPSSLIGHGDPIVYPREGTKVEHEGELCLVIGRPARRVSPAEAPRVVRGWCCGNDVTERDLQRKDRQWWRAKGFDTFAAIGPYLETEAPDPDAYIRTLVGGEVRQEGRVRDMLRHPYEIVSFISQAMTLLPGDVIMLGTPPGVSEIHPGDEVVVQIEGLDSLSNPVVAEDQAGP